MHCSERFLMNSMSRFVKLIGLLIITAVICEQLTAKFNTSLSEYERRSKIVNELVDLYAKYVNGKNTPDNGTLLEDFEDYYEENFDETDAWMMAAFTSDEDSIITSVLNETKNGYADTKAFLDTATKVMNSSFEVKIEYLKFKGSEEDIDNTEQIKILAGVLMAETVNDTLTYLKETAWKTQFAVDVDDIIKQHGVDPDVGAYIYQALIAKYPFRSWAVVVYNTETPASVCTNDIYLLRAVNGNDIWVFQADPDRPDNHDYGKTLLGNIPPSITSYWSCYNHMEEIVKESTYNCASKILPLFSLYTGQTPLVLADEKSILTKDIIRRPWFGLCESKYYAVLFV